MFGVLPCNGRDSAMTRYFFDLSDGAATALDDSGTILPDDQAAISCGFDLARDLMRNNEKKYRSFFVLVRQEGGGLLFTLPFVEIDETLKRLPPETRALIERCCERRRELAAAVRAAHKALRDSRALRARANGKPYLAALDGEAVG
jgi:hypothetical protein